jgi:23S rRNA (pseudouridine1915-N3)-methyltransferase
MDITILSMGRFGKHAPERELFEHYTKRLPWNVVLREHEIKGSYPEATLKEKEGEWILNAIPSSAYVYALDERGKSFDSVGFSKHIQRVREEEGKQIVFVIGGAFGLARSVKERANCTFCLGAMTWPHLLVRSMLAEQLYRAYTIIQNHPYHKS